MRGQAKTSAKGRIEVKLPFPKNNPPAMNAMINPMIHK